MQTIVIHAPGDLRVEAHPEAPPPGPGEAKIAVSKGGICGSDLHYFHNGGFGNIKLQEPMVLGHEVAGVITALGEGVSHLQLGDKVAVNPSMPCGTCQYCLSGQRNQCEDMRFFGSAMRFPHQQGLFRQNVTLPAQQLYPLQPETDLTYAACAEPLAVCLHAVRQAGSLVGGNVLVSGCGPIGCLTVLAAARAGAQLITATDLSDAPLAIAAQVGAHRSINLNSQPDALAALAHGKGSQDVIFECSGSPKALASALEIIKPGGTIILVGLGGEVPFPLNVAVAKEVKMMGSFRFDEEFSHAADLIDRKVVDLKPFVSSVIPFGEATSAFELASLREKSMKVQLDFDE